MHPLLSSRPSHWLGRGLLLAALCASPSCATMRKMMPHRHRKLSAAETAHLQPIGSISLVNEVSHFVLIDNGDLPAPSTGAVLKSFGASGETAELVTTEVRRRPFVIADIRSGAPMKGDRAMMVPDAAPATPQARAAKEPAPAPRPEPAPPAKRSWWKIWPWGGK